MGSNSSKTKSRPVSRSKGRSTKVDLAGGGNNVPDVLVSILRQKAVLVCEGVSVATQTDDLGFSLGNMAPSSTLPWNETMTSKTTRIINSGFTPSTSVSYDIEYSGNKGVIKGDTIYNKEHENSVSKETVGENQTKPDSTIDQTLQGTENKVDPVLKSAQIKPKRERSDMSTNTTVTAISGFPRDTREVKQAEWREVEATDDVKLTNATEETKHETDTVETKPQTAIAETKPETSTEDNTTAERARSHTPNENKNSGADVDENSKLGIETGNIKSGNLTEEKKQEVVVEQRQGSKMPEDDPRSSDGPYLERYGKYRVRVEDDKEKCTISAVTFLDTGDLVLIDRSNKRIKFVDSEFRYISTHDLPAQPWSVCARGVDVYVTIGNTQIQHLYVKDMLIEPERIFEVKGRCLGICISGEHIAVGLQVGEIHLLDTMGEIHKTIKLPFLDNGKPCNPWHVSVSHEQNLLVTDSDAGTVFCIDTESQMVRKFCEMSSPRCATVDCHGNMIVVGRDNETGVVVTLVQRDWELGGILHMEQGTKTESKALLTWRDLEFVPYCVDYRKDGVLVLGGIRETLKIMKLKQK